MFLILIFKFYFFVKKSRTFKGIVACRKQKKLKLLRSQELSYFTLLLLIVEESININSRTLEESCIFYTEKNVIHDN